MLRCGRRASTPGGPVHAPCALHPAPGAPLTRNPPACGAAGQGCLCCRVCWAGRRRGRRAASLPRRPGFTGHVPLGGCTSRACWGQRARKAARGLRERALQHGGGFGSKTACVYVCVISMRCLRRQIHSHKTQMHRGKTVPAVSLPPSRCHPGSLRGWFLLYPSRPACLSPHVTVEHWTCGQCD